MKRYGQISKSHRISKIVIYALYAVLTSLILYCATLISINIKNSVKITKFVSKISTTQNREYFTFTNSKLDIAKQAKDFNYDISLKIADTRTKNTDFNYLDGDYYFHDVTGRADQLQKKSNLLISNFVFDLETLIIRNGFEEVESSGIAQVHIISPSNPKIHNADITLSKTLMNLKTRNIYGASIFVHYRDGILKSDAFSFISRQNAIIFDGNFATETDQYKLFANHATFLITDENITDITANGKVSFVRKKDNLVVLGDNFNIDQINKRIYATGNIRMISVNGTISGDEFKYDGTLGIGAVTSKTNANNNNEKVKITL